MIAGVLTWAAGIKAWGLARLAGAWVWIAAGAAGLLLVIGAWKQAERIGAAGERVRRAGAAAANLGRQRDAAISGRSRGSAADRLRDGSF